MKLKILILTVLLGWLFQLQACNIPPQKWLLYQKGQIVPILIIPDKPKGNETKAALLFQQTFHGCTGVQLNIVGESKAKFAKTSPGIFIGQTRMAAQSLKKFSELRHDGFVIQSKENQLIIGAKDNIGLLFAVSSFFENVGHVQYVDQKEIVYPQRDNLEIEEGERISNPAFSYRQCYFRQARDYDYVNWQAGHLFEEKWSVWGHSLHKIIDQAVLNKAEIPTLFALVNNERQTDQYCFTSPALYKALVSGIPTQLAKNPDANYMSIAPNDNSIICQCESCRAINQSDKSNTAAVTSLMAKLANQFPNITFTTLAYGTTLKADKIKLPANTAVLVSTIDWEKGIPLDQSKHKATFEHIIQSWKQSSPNIFIWDYTTQYTNYNDLFPNLPALQKDLQYFTRLGVTGVFEHGSEDHYSCLDDYKSFMISHWLWNPNLPLDSLKYVFFENAYPQNADYLAEFITAIETKQTQAKILLPIYGNIKHSIPGYMSPTDFDLFFYELDEKISQSTGKEKIKLEQLKQALRFNKLEWMRSNGYQAQGFANLSSTRKIEILPETKLLLEKLLAYDRLNPGQYYSEVRDSIQGYVTQWQKYILPDTGVNLLGAQPYTMLSKHDGTYQGDGGKALTDGAIGFHDYSLNWLIFHNQPMDVKFSLPTNSVGKQLQVSFLNDPRHHIFLPQTITVFGEEDGQAEILLKEETFPTAQNTEIQRITWRFNIPNGHFSKIRILAKCIPALPEWIYHPTKKPTLACDEVQLK